MRPLDLDIHVYYISVSIHASVKDATQLRAFKAGLYLVSIHASVKDATQIFEK